MALPAVLGCPHSSQSFIYSCDWLTSFPGRHRCVAANSIVSAAVLLNSESPQPALAVPSRARRYALPTVLCMCVSRSLIIFLLITVSWDEYQQSAASVQWSGGAIAFCVGKGHGFVLRRRPGQRADGFSRSGLLVLPHDRQHDPRVPSHRQSVVSPQSPDPPLSILSRTQHVHRSSSTSPRRPVSVPAVSSTARDALEHSSRPSRLRKAYTFRRTLYMRYSGARCWCYGFM